MNENNDHYISLKEIITESIIRDLILFTLLFLFIIAQNWDNILLVLFPLITFTFSLFFRIISSSKHRTRFQNSHIIYNPLGLEKRNANRLFFSAILQLTLIFWLGSESLYNPHLVSGYLAYFIGFFIFFYTFGFFWIFIDLWKYSKIEIITSKFDEHAIEQNKIEFAADLDNVITFLNLKYYKLISFVNIVTFIILNCANLISLALVGNIPVLGLQLSLPGSGNVGLGSINVSYIFYMVLVIPPLLTTTIFFLNYKKIGQFNFEKLNEILKPLPKNLQIKIVESLKLIDSNLKEKLRME